MPISNPRKKSFFLARSTSNCHIITTDAVITRINCLLNHRLGSHFHQTNELCILCDNSNIRDGAESCKVLSQISIFSVC